MVEIHTLACLDYLMWLRTGDEVAKRTGLNQSTIEVVWLFWTAPIVNL
jgi:hypothetical protein